MATNQNDSTQQRFFKGLVGSLFDRKVFRKLFFKLKTFFLTFVVTLDRQS